MITDQFPELKGSIESRVVVYDWSSKQKVVASSDLDYAVQKVSFNPKDWQ